MKYKAVIFDLFGTLIENYPESEFQCTVSEVSSVVSADQDRFIKLWNEHFNNLMTDNQLVGKCIALVCEKMGLFLENEQLNNAYKIMTDKVRFKMEPSKDTLAALSCLADRNLRIGLISNCSNEVPAMWRDFALAQMTEKPIFSCSVGLMKPDPRIYLLAAEWLGVKSEECIFVDDNLEPLEGAAGVGMKPILIQDPRLNEILVDSNGWHGHIISSMDELITVLDEIES